VLVQELGNQAEETERSRSQQPVRDRARRGDGIWRHHRRHPADRRGAGVGPGCGQAALGRWSWTWTNVNEHVTRARVRPQNLL